MHMDGSILIFSLRPATQRMSKAKKVAYILTFRATKTCRIRGNALSHTRKHMDVPLVLHTTLLYSPLKPNPYLHLRLCQHVRTKQAPHYHPNVFVIDRQSCMVSLPNPVRMTPSRGEASEHERLRIASARCTMHGRPTFFLAGPLLV
jgi:hypothetical protein